MLGQLWRRCLTGFWTGERCALVMGPIVRGCACEWIKGSGSVVRGDTWFRRMLESN